MHVVLIEPEIHMNTGNIGRSCVGTDTTLHLVGKLGFSLDSAQIRRSGLDYWQKLDLKQHESWQSFEKSLAVSSELFFFSREGGRTHYEAPYTKDCYLVFGKESVGLPQELRERFKDSLYRVPVNDKIRSLNLSSCVTAVLFEALRPR